MAKIRIRTQFDTDEDPGLSDFGPSMTRQEFLEESDINNIINQYETTGVVGANGNTKEPIYGDFTDPNLSDYQTALNTVLTAQQAFESLNARIRERFNNDPASLIAFVADPANRKEGQELGIINPDPVAAPPADATAAPK